MAPDDVDLERDRASHRRAGSRSGPCGRVRVGHDVGVAGSRRRLPARGDVRTEVRAEHRIDVPAEHRPRAVAQERVATLRIGREDEVGRRRGERPIADLRIAQLALEPVAFAHVADGTVAPDEAAGLVEPGRGDELGRDGRAVAAQHVDPAAELLRPLAIPDAQSKSATSRDDSWTSAPKWRPISSLRPEAGHPLDRVRDEGEARVRPDRPDEVRRVLDEVAIALLRLGQPASAGSSW